jgi:PIN domain nuclease of toxin-antitoxin system
MNYLVDTHYLLWTLIEPQRISQPVEEILRSDEHLKYVSAVSFWEISLKYALGKLQLSGTTPEEILPASVESGFQVLALEASEAAGFHTLPPIPRHKDPFDRMLVWQCVCHDFTLISGDERLSGYRQAGLRLL